MNLLKYILLAAAVCCLYTTDCFSQKKTGARNSKNTVSTQPPRTKAVTDKYLDFTRRYRILATDSSVIHGKFEMRNNEKQVVEEGKYNMGKRVGIWNFYGLGHVLELQYDYDHNRPVKIQPHTGFEYTPKNYPPIFLGSPTVPYHHIVWHSKYPTHETEKQLDCKVVLELDINAQGKMTGYRLLEESKPDFNESVINAAEAMPKDWQWVPAHKNGVAVKSTYRIIVLFDFIPQ